MKKNLFQIKPLCIHRAKTVSALTISALFACSLLCGNYGGNVLAAYVPPAEEKLSVLEAAKSAAVPKSGEAPEISEEASDDESFFSLDAEKFPLIKAVSPDESIITIKETVATKNIAYVEVAKEITDTISSINAIPSGWPVNGLITSYFGYRDDPLSSRTLYHTGIDIDGVTGQGIESAGSGRVIYSGWEKGGWGNVVLVSHGNGYSSFYAHCSEVLVEAGQTVSKGEKIALIGSTGRATGSHLHFEIRYNGVEVDPIEYLE